MQRHPLDPSFRAYIIPSLGEVEDALFAAERQPQEPEPEYPDGWPNRADLERERQILNFLGIQ